MKKVFKTLMSIVGAVLVAVSLSFSAVAMDSSEKTIRVGYIDYQAFIDKSPEGTYSGYGVDYLNEIAKYSGFKYEYVYGTWQECIDRLANKEIDLVCTAKYTKERDESFDFSKFPIGTEQGVLYTLPENTSLYYDDFIGLNGANIGFIKGNLTVQAFRTYAKNNNFVFNEKYYDTEEDMKRALASKEITVLATEHMSLHNDLKLIGKYGSEPFYFMSYDGNDFMEEIDWAASKIKVNNKDFE
ncbi:MAG: transporter substrate-binding domain-containing protein, partial [Oscillospiraceae bacterium]